MLLSILPAALIRALGTLRIKREVELKAEKPGEAKAYVE
jgi:hypothetical protein